MTNRLRKYFSAGLGLLPMALFGQDLVITGAQSPEGPFLPGATVPLVVTIANPGDPETDLSVPAGTGFKVEAVVDTLGTFASASKNEAIEAGGTLDVTVEVVVPQSAPNGRYNVDTLTVDSEDTYAESNEGNNVLADAGAVAVEAFADLTITGVEPSDGPHFPGNDISFEVQFENNGERAAGNFDVRVSVEAPSTGNGFTITGSYPGTVAPGAAGTIVLTDSIPYDNPNGTYEVTAFIDSGFVVDEGGNEANNSAEASFAIDTTPDLEIIDLSFDPGTWEGGDPVDFSLEYWNAPSFGTNDTLRVDAIASQSYEIEVVLSSDGEFGNEDDFLLFETEFIGDPDGGIDTVTGNSSFNLLPGQGYAFSWTQRMPENYFGDYFVLARIDVRDNVTEYVEDDRRLNGNNTWYTVETAKITLVPSDSPKPVTTLASVRADGSQGEALSEQPDMSQDGRYLVFSTLSQLDPADTDDNFDVYLRDHLTGEVRLLSNGNGNGTGGDAQYPAISADGRYVVFQSDAGDLVAGDSNGHIDIFRVRLETGQIRRVSVSAAGEQSNSSSFSPDISGDGRYVVFASQADNLAATPVSPGRTHVYVHDAFDGTTSLVSFSLGGAEANGSSFAPEISNNGAYVVFTSEATDIDPAVAPTSARNVYRAQRDGSDGRLLSQLAGVAGNANSYDPSISADGSIVAFVSEATNLDTTTPDTNGLPDIFIYDFSGPSLGRIISSDGNEFNLPSAESSGDVGALEPSISADGRFVVFKTQSDNLLPFTVERSDGTLFAMTPYGPGGYSFGSNEAIVGFSDLNSTNHFSPYAGSDIYLFDRQNPGRLEQISRNKFGYPATAKLEEVELEPMVPSSRNPVISGNGRFVAFASDARGDAGLAFGRNNRESLDGNGVRDIFLRDRRSREGFNLPNPPTVLLLSPVAGETAVVGENMLLEVDASDDGFIASVDFYVNGLRVGSSPRGEFFTFWTPGRPGIFEVMAVATDDDGVRVATETIEVVVSNATAPTITLTTPEIGDTVFVNRSLTLAATASDADGVVAAVDFYMNGELVASDPSAPYSFAFSGTDELPFAPGVYQIYAVARDNEGYTSYASPVTVEAVNPDAPAITHVSPDPLDADADDIADTLITVGSPTTFSALVEDSGVLIDSVNLLVNGIQAGTASPENGTWSTQFTANSLGTLQVAWEVIDQAGNQYRSDDVTFLVNSGALPSITLLQPDPADTDNNGIADTPLFRNVEQEIAVAVTDADGAVENVTASINGGPAVAMQEADQIGRYRILWTPSLLGENSLVIAAEDDIGNRSVITARYEITGGASPSVVIVNPDPADTNGDGLADTPVMVNQSIDLTVQADDPEGSLAPVLVRINGSDYGTALEQQRRGEYSIEWTPQLLGEHLIEFVVTDDTGNEVVAAMRYLVTSGDSPTISFLSPIEGSRFLPGTNLSVQVQASDSDGLIREVRFFLNGVFVQSVGAAPFRTEISLPSPATYRLVAVAVDNTGNETATPPLTVEAAQPDAESPRVVIDHPLPLGGGDTINDVSVPSAMFLNATATDPNGSIADVRFYINGELLGSFENKVGDSYSIFYDPNAPGNYVLNAEAIDDQGNRTFSSPILLDVGPLQSPMPNGEIYQPFAESVLGRSVGIFVEADAGLNDITRVDFFANGVFVGSQEDPVNNDLFLFNWVPDVPGDYELRARIVQVDPGGNPWDNWLITDAASVTVTDPGAGTDPTIELVSPQEGDSHTVLNPIELEADALDPLGSITEVRFYANGRLLDINDDGSEPFGDDRYPYSMSFTPLSPGQYQIVAELLSDRGIRLHSEPVTIDVAPSQTPNVRISYPGDGAAVSVGRPLLITANTDSTGGGQMDLTFYANGVLIGSDSTFPYNISWTPQSTGTFQIKVEAREAGTTGPAEGTEGVAVSDEVTVTVNPTELPTGNIISPSGANPTVGSDVLIEVEANDIDGFVSQVEFFVNGSPLGMGADTTEPFATFWRPGSAGMYDLTTLITDNSGNQTVVSRSVEVVDPVGVVPRVTLSVTASGNVTPGSRVVVRANVFDDNPEEVDVTFFMNGTQLGPADTEPPYSIILDPEVLSFNAYEITAVAADADGNSRADVLSPLYISDVTVDQPSIDIISLGEGETLTLGSRAPIRVDVAGGAVANLQTVVFYADGVEIGRDDTAPYSFDWIPDRTGDIQITAATLLQTSLFDHDDNEFTDEIEVTPVNVASPVNVTVNDAVGQLPSISLDILPQRDNLAVGSKVLLYADAQDLDGAVETVSFYADGVEVGTDTEAPFTHVLTTTKEGRTALNALATDDSGNVVTSTFVRLEVTPRVITRTPGIVLTVPESGQEGSPLSLRASADGFVNGPEAVVFYVNGQPVGQAESAPYSLSWLANLNGEVTFFSTARQELFDGTVISTVSNIVSSDLSENVAPRIESVEVGFPDRDDEDKPNPLVGEQLTFTIDVSDSGPTRTVELLRDGEPVATSESLSTPYEILDTPPGLGAYAYSVVVTDRGGLQAQSASIPVSVVQGSAPVVAILSPEEGETFNPQAVIRLRASAEDVDGMISEVRFLVNGLPVGEMLTAPPYELDYVPAVAGSYEVTVRARDNSGNLTVTPERSFNVLADNPPSFAQFVIRADSNLEGSAQTGYTARLNQPITFVMEAEDDYGIESVKLFRNGTEITTGVAIPIEITDTPPSLGKFRYFAEATDTGGNVTRTEPVEIELTRGTPPIVQIVEPVSGTSYSLDQGAGGLAIRASATAGKEPVGIPSGSITSVEFLVNGRTLGTVENPPYIITTGDFVEGDNSVVAVATSDTGLRTTSAEITVDGVVGSVPEILTFSHDAGPSGVLVGSEIQFAVEAIDDSGIEKVELLLNGEVVDVTTTSPFQLQHAPLEAGNYNYTAKVTNNDGNFVISEDAITVNVRLPDPTGNNADFVYQTFEDLFFRAPTAEEQGRYANRLEGGDLTRARFVQELMQPEGGLTGTAYAPIRNTILVHRFLLGEWPTREELATSVGITRDSGLTATVSSLMPMAQARFVETVNNDPVNFVLTEPATGVPDILSPQEQIDAYIHYLFLQKYGVVPDAAQMNLLQLHFRSANRDGFTAALVSDVDVFATGNSYLTLGLGLSFPSMMPPSDRYLRNVDAASLLVNFLRVQPQEEEVEELAGLLFTEQVRRIVADDRYTARFRTPFPELQHFANSWKRSKWFGWFNTMHEPWIYHRELGWLAFGTRGQEGWSFWYYDSGLGWSWTQDGFYPNFYSSAETRWLRTSGYPFEAGQPRWFQDLSTTEWIQR